MKVINKLEKHFDITVSLNEVEILALVETIEQVNYMMNRPLEEIGGIRGELYKQFKDILKSS